MALDYSNLSFDEYTRQIIQVGSCGLSPMGVLPFQLEVFVSLIKI